MIIKESDLLISIFSEVIGIDILTIKKLISENKTANFFLAQEKALSITSSLENLKILVRFILARNYGDLSRINKNDINFINKEYTTKINSSQIIEGKNYSDIEIIDLFEQKRNIAKELRISNILNSCENCTNFYRAETSSSEAKKVADNLVNIDELIKNYNRSVHRKNKRKNKFDSLLNTIIHNMVETITLLNSSVLKTNKEELDYAKLIFAKFFKLPAISSRRDISKVYYCKSNVDLMLHSLEKGQQIKDINALSKSIRSFEDNPEASYKVKCIKPKSIHK